MHESTPFFSDTVAGGHTWERRSPSAEDDHVLVQTWRWLAALPKGVRPVHLPAAFPRIANDLFRLWSDTASLELYFEEKVVSLRPFRQGFPPLIKEELLAMQVHSLRDRPGPSGGLASRQVPPTGVGDGLQGPQLAAISGANAVW